MRSTPSQEEQVLQGVARIRNKLIRRHYLTKDSDSDVYITDILATEHIEPADYIDPLKPDAFSPEEIKNFHLVGEFHKNRFQSPEAASAVAKEHESKLIDRIFKKIAMIATHAKHEHTANNFTEIESKIKGARHYSIKRGHKNHITRIITNEFMFWPAKERGPLSENGLQILIESIENLAKKLPTNLHLALGTFPVRDFSTNHVYNQMIYVECGFHPKLTIISKAFPSSNDLYYPGTVNPFFTTGFYPQKLIQGIRSKINELIQLLNQINSFLQEDTYLNIEKAKSLVSDIEVIFAECINEYGSEITIPTPDIFISKLSDLVDMFERRSQANEFNAIIQEINHVFKNYYDDMERVIIEKATTPIIPIIRREFSLNVNCQTAGGIRLTIIGDICLDFIANISRKKLIQEQKSNLGKQIMPNLVSQFISSASIPIGNKDRHRFHTEAGPISQADSKRTQIHIIKEDETTEAKTKKTSEVVSIKIEKEYITKSDRCPFGNYIDFHLTRPTKLTPYKPEILEKIIIGNGLALEINALEIYRRNHPEQSPIIDIIINHQILAYLNRSISTLFQNPHIENATRELHIEIMRMQFTPQINRTQIISLLTSALQNAEPALENIIRPYLDYFILLNNSSHEEMIYHPLHEEEKKMPVSRNSSSALFNPSSIRTMRQHLGEEFKDLPFEENLAYLLRSGILRKEDVKLMNEHAQILLKEPHCFTHVFKAIRELGNDFQRLEKSKKLALFNLPFETFKQVIRHKIRRDATTKQDIYQGEMPIFDYLAKSPEEQKALNTASIKAAYDRKPSPE